MHALKVFCVRVFCWHCLLAQVSRLSILEFLQCVVLRQNDMATATLLTKTQNFPDRACECYLAIANGDDSPGDCNNGARKMHHLRFQNVRVSSGRRVQKSRKK